MEQPHMWHILKCQYHACWCPGDLRSQGTSRHSTNPPKPEYSVSSIWRVTNDPKIISDKFNDFCSKTARNLSKHMAQTTKKSYLQFLPEASFGHWVLSLPAYVCGCVCVRVCVSLCVNHLLVCAISRDPFKLWSPNLDQRCKRFWLRSLLFLTLTFKIKFNLKVRIYHHLSLSAT